MNVSAVWGRFAMTLALLAPAATAQEGQGDVVYVPTPQVVVEEMLAMAKVGPADYVIDLGSGDGRIVITAAKKFGARGFGVDLDRYLLKVANDSAREEGVADRARFFEQNLFETDLTPATVITTYLLPEMNLKLRPKILALRPGTRVVAHDYDMDDWYPDRQSVLDVPEKVVGEPGKSYIFLWIVPAKVAGEWSGRVIHDKAALAYDFTFEQEFQFVAGTARIGGHEVRVPEFRLAGDRIEFSLKAPVGGRTLEHRFEGTVRGDAIDGTVTVSDGKTRRELPWRLKQTKIAEVSYKAVPPRQFRKYRQ